MSSLDALDAFLAHPSQRELSRALLACVFPLRGLAVIVGDARGETATRLATLLAQQWPTPQVHLMHIDAAPTRIAIAGRETRVLEGVGTEVALRAALRQDPDVIVLTSLEAAAAPKALSAVHTGHAVLLGTNAPDVEPVLQALCGPDAGMLEHARASLELIIELTEHDGRMVVQRVVRRHGTTLTPVAQVQAGQVVVDHSVLPVAVDTPSLQAPRERSLRSVATQSPRRAWVPEVGEGAGWHALGTTMALLPVGAAWPACRSCQAPLQLIVQLDLSALPAEFALPVREGLAQLFVCPEGCETSDEAAPGVLAQVLTGGFAPVRVTPRASHRVLSPGTIIDWHAVDEEPGSEDRARLSLPATEDDAAGPLRADKLGGWPAWAQAAEWPLDDDGAPMTLLFQVVEGELRVGGTPAGWSFEEARVVPGAPAVRVLDVEAPQHFSSLLTGEATALLFIGKRGQLAFRWQTG